VLASEKTHGKKKGPKTTEPRKVSHPTFLSPVIDDGPAPVRGCINMPLIKQVCFCSDTKQAVTTAADAKYVLLSNGQAIVEGKIINSS
jgi:hypothetical protein